MKTTITGFWLLLVLSSCVADSFLESGDSKHLLGPNKNVLITVGTSHPTVNAGEPLYKKGSVATAIDGKAVVYVKGTIPSSLAASSAFSIDEFDDITVTQGEITLFSGTDVTINSAIRSRGKDLRRFIIGTRSISTASIGSIRIRFDQSAIPPTSYIYALSGSVRCAFEAPYNFPDALLSQGYKLTMPDNGQPTISAMTIADY